MEKCINHEVLYCTMLKNFSLLTIFKTQSFETTFLEKTVTPLVNKSNETLFTFRGKTKVTKIDRWPIMSVPTINTIFLDCPIGGDRNC